MLTKKKKEDNGECETGADCPAAAANGGEDNEKELFAILIGRCLWKILYIQVLGICPFLEYLKDLYCPWHE